jgi:predicted GNAT family acetyltransferase
MATAVRNNTAQHRYELDIDGTTAFTEYTLGPGMITLRHTEVPKGAAGRGVGSALARGVLQAVRAQGLKVIPRCPFIARYIRKHREFQDLLA